MYSQNMKKLLLLPLLTLLLTSCGTNNTTYSLDEEFPTITDSRPNEEKMVDFVTLNGNLVTYNQNTRKIVCTFGSQDIVAFGIHLLAYEQDTDTSGFESLYEGSSKLIYSTPISAEEILSYHPELILVNEKMSADTIKTLTHIAPVIPLYTDSTDFEQRLSYIGDIFNMKEEAKTLIDYSINLKNAMIDKIDALSLRDKTVTLFTYMGGISIPPDRGWFMNTIIYDYCGLKRKDNVYHFMTDESVIAYNTISSEKIKDYEGDLVIYAGFDGDKISTYVSENPGWQNLDAVKENRVGTLDITVYQQKGIILLHEQYLQVFNALKVASGEQES